VARISLESVLNGSFIKQIGAAAQSGPGAIKGFSEQPFGSQDSGSINFASSLRVGARTFSNAIQGVNLAISFLNVGQETLGELLGITEKLIEVTERATKNGIGRQQRAGLNSQFQELALEFKSIVKDAQIGDKEVLTRGGLEELFVNLGLDTEKSKGLSGIFAEFALVEDEDGFANEKAKAERPLRIPNNAFVVSSGGVSFAEQSNLVTTTASGSVSTGTTENTALYVNGEDPGDPGVDTVVIDSQGITTESLNEAMLMPGLDDDIVVQAVDQSTGNYVFSTTSDLTGENTGLNQLFLADADGNVIRQVTSFAGNSPVAYGDVAVSENGDVVIYSAQQGATAFLEIIDYTDPENPTVERVEEVPGALSPQHQNLAISQDGTNFAYADDFGNVSSGIKGDPDALQFQGNFYALAEDNQIKLGFASNSDLVIAAKIANDEIEITGYSYELDQSVSVLTSDEFNIDTLNILQATPESDSQLVYLSVVDDQVYGVSLDDGLTAGLETQIFDPFSGPSSPEGLTLTGQLSAAIDGEGDIILGLGFDLDGQESVAFTKKDQEGVLSLTQFVESSLSGMFSEGAVISGSNLLNSNYSSAATLFLDPQTNVLNASLTQDATLLGTSAGGQFGVIEAREQLIDGNPGLVQGERALYLIDQYGKVISQVTTITSVEEVLELGVSDDGFISLARLDQGQEPAEISLETFRTSDFETFAHSIRLTEEVAGAESLRAFSFDNGNTKATAFSLRNLAGEEILGRYTSFAIDLLNDGSQYNQVSIFNGNISAIRQNGLTEQLVTVDIFDSDATTVLLGGLDDVGQFQAVQSDSGGPITYLIEERGISSISLFRSDQIDQPYKVFYSNDSQISDIQIQRPLLSEITSNFSYEFLVQGDDFSFGSGASNSGLNRFQVDINLTGEKRVSSKLPEPESLFSSDRVITRRPLAYQALADLKELRSQIETNLEVSDELADLLEKNVDLLRAAGTAFLELSSSVKSGQDAESLAYELRLLIRRNAPQALSQAENLESLVVAALTVDYQGITQ